MILCLETATPSCSVALVHNGEVLACEEDPKGQNHSEKITLFIDSVMKKAGISYNQLDAVAVSMGPGSYTGLRIGVSTAKGICYAVSKPLIAVETLEAMAYGIYRVQLCCRFKVRDHGCSMLFCVSVHGIA